MYLSFFGLKDFSASGWKTSAQFCGDFSKKSRERVTDICELFETNVGKNPSLLA
jgi:hypothetical protein